MSVIILDFGSQYTQLIARRIRELKVYAEIQPYALSIEEIQQKKPAAIILSGGPSSCYEPDAPTVSPKLLELGIPILGICYGAQLIAKMGGGHVVPADKREYGLTQVLLCQPAPLFEGFQMHEAITVWASHGDHVATLPAGFALLAETANAPRAAFAHLQRRIYCVQFHPEVAHTPRGGDMLHNFLFRIVGAEPHWTMTSYAAQAVERIRTQVGKSDHVICALSGGVDSSVACALVHRAIGNRLTCIFVDNGLLRSGERDLVASVFQTQFAIPLQVVDAEERFLRALAGVVDPEKKRKIIGHEFIAVFEEEAKRLGKIQWLVQGTLYPDVIESVSFKGPSATIKTHHNVGGLPEHMHLKLIEPLRELFKDEVRALGAELGLPPSIILRQPFPGPGLAVRCLGAVTRERLHTLRAADAIIDEEIRKAGLYEAIWQSFGVLLPVRSVGVMGDQRTYHEALAIRAVYSQDGMTADWVPLSHDLLATLSRRIINEVHGINRVVYDISSKPPATIEWE